MRGSAPASRWRAHSYGCGHLTRRPFCYGGGKTSQSVMGGIGGCSSGAGLVLGVSLPEGCSGSSHPPRRYVVGIFRSPRERQNGLESGWRCPFTLSSRVKILPGGVESIPQVGGTPLQFLAPLFFLGQAALFPKISVLVLWKSVSPNS